MKTITKDGRTFGLFPNIEKIQVEDEFVIVDKDAEIKEDDFGYNGNFWKIIHIGKGINKSFGLIYAKHYRLEHLEEGKYHRELPNNLKKVISTSKSLIDKYQMNVPEFISKEEQEIHNSQIAFNSAIAIEKGSPSNIDAHIRGFIAGYKAHQNKYEELIDFVKNIRDDNQNVSEDYQIRAEKLLQSFQDKEVYLEVEQLNNKPGSSYEAQTRWQLKVTNNKIFEL
jgi:hypothetical protein